MVIVTVTACSKTVAASKCQQQRGRHHRRGFWTWLQHHENLIRSVLQRCKSCTKTRMPHTQTDNSPLDHSAQWSIVHHV